MGDGPTRFAGTKPQLTLRGQAVDLEHHAIDFIGQRRATLTDVAVILQTLGNALGQFQLMADGHAPFLQLLEIADVRVSKFFRHLAQAVTAKFQRTAGGDLRVELPQAARRRVTRVREGFAASRHLGFVQALKPGLGHKHFTPHLQHGGPATAVQLERDVAHGPHVDADVFTRGAITSRGTAHQMPVPVQQTDRQAIQLGLAAVFDLGTATKQVAGGQIQPFIDPAVELAHVRLIEGVAQTQHRHFMADLREGRQRSAAHPLGRGVRRDPLGMLGFQRFELMEQTIVFGVRDARLVEHVVAIVVLIQFSAQR